METKIYCVYCGEEITPEMSGGSVYLVNEEPHCSTRCVIKENVVEKTIEDYINEIDGEV